LANVYIDNYGYQENVLTKMHKLQGHDVMIVASTETFVDKMNLGYVKPSSYFTEHGIPITRIPYVGWLPHYVARKLRIYKGLTRILIKFKPDIIFLHDVQFVSITEVAKYAKAHKKVTIYADGHADFINSARNWISKNILHKIIYKKCAKIIEPYTKKFYGVLPLRVEFFKNVYKIAPEKVELLLMGGDLSEVDFSKKDEIRKAVREAHSIKENDFLIITGGKIDKLKNVHLLMQAVDQLNIENMKLVVFGKVSSELKEDIETLSKSEKIRFIGWIPSENVYNYFLASDLAFFPGTHSVLWEQSISVGLPGVFKKWRGIQHIDVGGNAKFLEEITIENIQTIIREIYFNEQLYNNMKEIALNAGISEFSYYEIAKRAIEQ
jgi:glycosyltransferase involved in cell wall biosynthesis